MSVRFYDGILDYLPYDIEKKEPIDTYDLTQSDKPEFKYLSQLKPVEDGLTEGWIRKEGKFIGILFLSCAYWSVDMSADQAEGINDGYFTLYVVNKCNTISLLKLFVTISFLILIC